MQGLLSTRSTNVNEKKVWHYSHTFFSDQRLRIPFNESNPHYEIILDTLSLTRQYQIPYLNKRIHQQYALQSSQSLRPEKQWRRM